MSLRGSRSLVIAFDWSNPCTLMGRSFLDLTSFIILLKLIVKLIHSYSKELIKFSILLKSLKFLIANTADTTYLFSIVPSLIIRHELHSNFVGISRETV